MNVQDYISSGIVESCVLGLASPEERVEFESMCRQYPEVLQARIDFELSLEQQAIQNAIAPPPALKQQILNVISSSDTKVVSLSDAVPLTKRSWLKYAAAASIILLAGSLIWNISQYSRNKKLQATYDGLVKEYDSTVVKLTEMEDQVDKMVGLDSSSPMKMAVMKGLAISPNSFATVYWDTTSKDVYLVVNNLPKPASDQQYQLWALFNGNPVDVGMIDNNIFTGEKKLMIQMKNVSGAQAFAITLEKKGGNPTPQGAMYVLGNL